MFEHKKTTLYYEKPEAKSQTKLEASKSITEMNPLERFAYEQEHVTTSGNGAYKLDTSGDLFVDDFAAIARYKTPRDPQEIFETVGSEWCIDPLKALKMAAYIRGISRDVKFDGSKTRNIGQGLRHEYYFRILWLASQNVDNFVENADVLVAIGSEKDLFDMWRLQLAYGESIVPEDAFCEIICRHLQGDNAALVAKYLPTIRSRAKQSTLQFQMNSHIGRKISDYIWPDKSPQARREAYRHLKSSGNGHVWQQQISRQEYADINWDNIPGRALTKLVNSKFVKNHTLEDSLAKWATNQKTIKTTSYPFELVCEPTLNAIQQDVANKQFMTLVEQIRDNKSDMIVTVDVSWSMTAMAYGTKFSSYKVAHSMAALFAKALQGPFHDQYMTFSDTVSVRSFAGQTPYECVQNAHEEYCGSTDFLGVVHTLGKMKKQYPMYSESDFPKGILCISDGEFNMFYKNTSNFVEAKEILRSYGFSEEFVDNFKIALWDIPNGYYSRTKPVFESFADAPGFFYMSGFDGAAIQFLTTGEYTPPKTALELLEAALGQDVLNMLKAY